MPTRNDQHSVHRFTLQIAGLSMPEDQKPALEKTADELAEKVDAERHLDPLDAEPAIIFDPK